MSDPKRGAVIDLKVGQSVTVGGIVITLEHKSGKRARIRVLGDVSEKIVYPKRAAIAAPPTA